MMRIKILATAASLLLTLAVLPAAQSAVPMDEELSGELEIMSSILSKTLEFASDRKLRDNNIEAYYLPEQGAVFVVNLSTGFLELAHNDGVVLALEQASLEAERQHDIARSMQETMELYQQALDQARAEGLPDPPPPPPPAPIAPAAPKPSRVNSSEAVIAPLGEVRGQLALIRERADEQRQKREEMFDQSQEALLKALAKHGGSLTRLRPQDHINIVINSRAPFGMLSQRSGQNSRVLSVKKSKILEYASGQINFEAFRSSVRLQQM